MEKTAIITGSAQRIGKAAAEALHAQGYNVLLHYRSTSTAPPHSPSDWITLLQVPSPP